MVMTDVDKLARIREAVTSWRMYGMPDDRLEEIEDALDSPSAAPVPCPSDCDDDCEADCHEGHDVPWKRDHQPEDCPSAASEGEEHRVVCPACGHAFRAYLTEQTPVPVEELFPPSAAPVESEVFERLPDEGSLPQYRLRPSAAPVHLALSDPREDAGQCDCAHGQDHVDPPSAAPVEPREKTARCCIGPFADGRHALNCWQKCQDCKGDTDGPDRCRCRDEPAPRTLLGRTLPDHIHVRRDAVNQAEFVLECSKHDNWPYEVARLSNRPLINGFLDEHAHGHVVEHREEPCQCAPGYAVCDSCRAKNYPPVVEHQPAQDSEAREVEWGVDRGAVFSKHSSESEALTVLDRCRSNGLRATLKRREVGPWQEADQ